MTDRESDGGDRRVAGLVGLALYGSALVGVLGILLALIALSPPANLAAAGLALAASGVALGLLANALLRR